MLHDVDEELKNEQNGKRKYALLIEARRTALMALKGNQDKRDTNVEQ